MISDISTISSVLLLWMMSHICSSLTVEWVVQIWVKNSLTSEAFIRLPSGLLIRISFPFFFPLNRFTASCHLWESDLRSGDIFSRIYFFREARRAERTLFLILFAFNMSSVAWSFHRSLIIFYILVSNHGLSVSHIVLSLTEKNSWCIWMVQNRV